MPLVRRRPLARAAVVGGRAWDHGLDHLRDLLAGRAGVGRLRRRVLISRRLSIGGRKTAMPKAREWMNTHSWLVNIIVCGIFIVLII
jgi:hypothetical protein